MQIVPSGGAGRQKREERMTFLRATKRAEPSPFSEIRQIDREKTLLVIAASTLGATSCLIAAVLVTMGVLA